MIPETAADPAILRIGQWRVDPSLNEISSEGRTVRLEPLGMRLLLCLARRAGRPVEMQQLLDEVWTGVIVAQGSVYQAIAQLRRTLGDDTDHPTYIDTVPRKGYRLIAPVEPWVRPAETPAHPENAPTSNRLRRFLLAGIVLAIAAASAAGVRIWLAERARLVEVLAIDRSIAVLPFSDMTEKQDQGYFADGMAEEVLGLLANVPGLRVIGRTSSFQFRGRSVDVRAIGDALKVAYVVEGSVRRSGDHVRVTAQLISTRDAAHRWSDAYDARLNDVLGVQDTIAANIARALDVTVTTSAFERQISNPEAYDLLLRGMQALDSNTKDGFERAIGLFTEALRRDPTSSSALYALARTYDLLGAEGWMAPSEAFGNAREFALRTLQRDPRNGLAHVVLADVHLLNTWDWQAAEKEVSEAFRLGPRNTIALNTAANIAGARGQWDRAEQFLRQALAQDPLDPTTHMFLGAFVYLRSGRAVEAEASIRRALQIAPRWGTGRYFLAICLLMQDRLQEALEQAQQELPQDGKYQATSAVLYAMSRRSDSDQALRMAIEQSQGDWPVSIAKLYGFRGEPDQAMTWLERAYQFRDSDLFYIKGDPQLRSLESDPRYHAFLRKMHLED